MGSSTSKVSRSATRRYPKQATSGVTGPRVATQANSQNPREQVSAAESCATRPAGGDGGDPDIVTGEFSRRLQQMGVVQPNPTVSHTSSAMPAPTLITSIQNTRPNPQHNPTLTALEARRRLQQEVEMQAVSLGDGNLAGRRFVDMRAIVDAMHMLSHGMNQDQVERNLKIESGALSRLGGPAIISHQSSAQ